MLSYYRGNKTYLNLLFALRLLPLGDELVSLD